MTLRELWTLFVRYWVLALAIVIACTLLGFCYASMKDTGDSYQAEAQVVAGSNLSSVAGLAESVKRDMEPELDGKSVVINVNTDTTVMTVTILAKGPDPQVCIEAANSIADITNESAAKIYSQTQNPYQGEVSSATEATAITTKSTFKFMLFGCVGGVFLALVVLMLFDFKKRPIIAIESVQSKTGLPVLDTLPAQNGEKLLANVRFSSLRLGNSGDSLSLLVIPVGHDASANEVVALLTETAASEGFDGLNVAQAQSLSESMAGAYAAKDADVVVVVAEQWKDSIPSLVSCIDELQFAEAKIAGLVFSRKSKHRSAL